MTISATLGQPAINATTQLVTASLTLMRVIVQATGAGAIDIYDNTATTGTPIFSTPASPPVGTIYELGIPVSKGIRVVCAAASPQLTVVYGYE